MLSTTIKKELPAARSTEGSYVNYELEKLATVNSLLIPSSP